MEKRVVIVGAGVSGLVVCKSLLSKGFNPQVFEADDGIGGIWRHTLQSTRLQNSKEAYRFTDFPWPSTVKDVCPTHTQVMEYLESYATHFNIFPCIKFNSKVMGIDYVGESYEEMASWDLWGGTGKAFGSNGKWHVKVQDTITCSVEVYHAEFVIICIGQFSGLPNIPEFPPNKGPELFKGMVLHCKDLPTFGNLGDSELIKRKRVTIIGAHKSAVDLATECALANGVEYPCTIVQRNAHWFTSTDNLLVMMLGYLFFNRFYELLVHKPGETPLLSFLATFLSPLRWVCSKLVESYLRWKFPLKKYGMLPEVSFGDDVSSCQLALLPENFSDKLEDGSIIIKNSKSFTFCKEGLILDEETRPMETDVVIFATGYKGDENIKNIFESPILQDFIMSSPTAAFPFYRQVIHPRIPQLAVIGYNETLFSVISSEIKTLWLTQFLDGKLALPSVRDMEKDVKLWGDHIKQITGRYFRKGCIGTDIWYYDQLCKDMGVNPRRKKGFLADLFIPYGPADYADLSTL